MNSELTTQNKVPSRVSSHAESYMRSPKGLAAHRGIPQGYNVRDRHPWDYRRGASRSES